MPLDPVLLDNTKAWFAKARKDIYSAEIDLAASPPAVEDALFHCQQAVEKALKGFLTWHDEPFGKTHQLRVIGAQCVELDSTLDSLVARVRPLTEFAWKFRYPGATYEPTIQEGRDALALAREAVEAILGRLPDEVRL